MWTDEQSEEEKAYYDRLSNLMNRCQRIEVFMVEGTLYEGHYISACKNFIKTHPEKSDFIVYLDKNYPVLYKGNI